MSAIVKSLEMQIDVNLFVKTCEITIYEYMEITKLRSGSVNLPQNLIFQSEWDKPPLSYFRSGKSKIAISLLQKCFRLAPHYSNSFSWSTFGPDVSKYT